MKHFLQENDFSKDEIKEIFKHAFAFKAERSQRPSTELMGQTWGLLFHKKSTRTRVSFEVGIRELGGNPLILDHSSTQIGRGESIADTVQVLSRYLDGLIIRTHGHDIIEKFASHANIPIVNALTDFLHPCQIFADCMTILEKVCSSEDIEDLSGKRLLSWRHSMQCGELLAYSWGTFRSQGKPSRSPEYAPSREIVEYLQKHGLAQNWKHHSNPIPASKDAEVLYTDVWVSMGFEKESENRRRLMHPFQVNDELLALAKPERFLCTACRPAQERKYPNPSSIPHKPSYLIKPKIDFTCKKRFFVN